MAICSENPHVEFPFCLQYVFPDMSLDICLPPLTLLFGKILFS